MSKYFTHFWIYSVYVDFIGCVGDNTNTGEYEM